MEIKKFEITKIMHQINEIIVPYYQRKYCWDLNDVETLILDIYNNSLNEYFVGSLIFKNQNGKKVIIDGQQRITTFWLIWKYLSLHLKDEHERKILEKDLKNISFYFAFLDEGNILQKILEEYESKQQQFSHDEMKSNYFSNMRHISKVIQENNLNVNELYIQLKKVIFVKIDVEQEVDEHLLFSQINSTGKMLNAWDLVKNFIFSKMGKIKQEDIEKMLEELSVISFEQAEENEELLREFIAYITYKKVNKNNLVIYKEFTYLLKNEFNNNIVDLYNSFYEFSLYFNYIKKGNLYNDLGDENDFLILKDSFNTYATLLIYIVKLNSSIQNNQIHLTTENKRNIKKLILILEGYKVRREFCGLNEKTITRKIPLIVKDLKNNTSDIDCSNKLFNALRDENKNSSFEWIMPSKEIFIRKYNELNIPIYKKSKKFTKAFLIKINNYNAMGTKIVFDNVWIEHIMPQKIYKWKEKGFNIEKDIYDEYLHTIGNLTILNQNLNSDISNDIFTFKKSKIYKHDQFLINKYFDVIDYWDEFKIKERAKYILNNYILKIWDFSEYEKFDYSNKMEQELNLKTFDKNKTHFKKVFLNYEKIRQIIISYLIYNKSYEIIEKEILSISVNGWITQSIIDAINIDKMQKGKLNQHQVNELILEKDNLIHAFLDYMKNSID